MKNVLLLCMSPISGRARMNTYLFEEAQSGNFFVDGVMTNEAPTKAVIRLLSKKKESQRLDKIIMICSDKINEAIELVDGQNDLDKIDCLKNEELERKTHADIYKKLISHYAEETDPCYAENPIEYVSISIPNITNEDEVSKAVIEAANIISEIDEKVELYIDFNGGQRYVAFMILAIANLMKIRSVSIKQIMTMNFDNKVDGIVPIQNMQPVFESFDLIAGINEYINYGRIKGLKKYFEASGNKEIQRILNEMEEFSNNLQLCRTDYVMENKAGLVKLLEDYANTGDENEQSDSYAQLFHYVVRDILKGYDGLLNGELPDIIDWCVSRDFIQQALTFCAEELPGYFWKSGIFTASSQEKMGYNLVLEKIYKAGQEFSSLKRTYRKEHPEGSSKYAYEWMTNYLPYSYKNRDYEVLLQDMKYSDKKIVFFGPETRDIDSLKKEKRVCDTVKSTFETLMGIFDAAEREDTEERKQRKRLFRDQFNKAVNITMPLVWQSRHKRVVSKKPKELQQILIVYYLLKNQRNKINHADSDSEEGEVWLYEQLCEMLRKMISIL